MGTAVKDFLSMKPWLSAHRKDVGNVKGSRPWLQPFATPWLKHNFREVQSELRTHAVSQTCLLK